MGGQNAYCRIGASLVLLTCLGTLASAADYAIREAVYRNDQGHFVGQAEIPQGESATVILSLQGSSLAEVRARRNFVTRTLRFSAPTKISSVETKGNGNNPSTIVLTCVTTGPPAPEEPDTEEPDAADGDDEVADPLTVEVRYSIEIPEQLRIIYDLAVETADVKPNGFSSGKITGHVVIDDSSRSNMNWQDANFRLRNELADFEVVDVNIPSGETRTRLIDELQNWPIDVNSDVSYLRMQNERDPLSTTTTGVPVYQVITLNLPQELPQQSEKDAVNNTLKGFPPGLVQVHDGAYRLSTTLDRGIALGQTTDIVADRVEGVTVDVEAVSDQKFQAIRLDGDQIRGDQWTATSNVTVQNESDGDVHFAFRSGDPFAVASRTRRSFKLGRNKGAVRTGFSISVFEIADESALTARLVDLRQIGRFETARLETLVPEIITTYEKIRMSRAQKTALENSLAVANALYDQLTRSGASKSRRRAAEQAIEQIRQRLKTVTPRETELLHSLAESLWGDVEMSLPAPTPELPEYESAAAKDHHSVTLGTRKTTVRGPLPRSMATAKFSRSAN